MPCFYLMFVCIVGVTAATPAILEATQDEDSSDLREQFRVLSKQVTALLERRREDLEIIEQNMRKELYETPEFQDIKNALKTLRKDVDSVQPGTPDVSQLQASTTEEKNERLTMKWLSNAISELRTEIGEVQAAVNSTVILQNHEQLDTELSLLRSDVSNLNSQLELAKNKNENYEAKLQMLQVEIGSLREFNRATATSCGKLKHQMKAMQLESARNLKTLQDIRSNEQYSQISEDRPYRHQRILKKHIIQLEKSSKELFKENHHIKSKLSSLEQNILILQEHSEKSLNRFDSINGNEIENYIENNRMHQSKDKSDERLANLTSQMNEHSESIANLTRHMTDFDKLHLSLLELLENVESIEFKVDNNFPDMRKEISKVEVQVNEVKAELSELKEEMSNSRSSMKAIGLSVSNLQDRNAEDHRSLKEVDFRVQNLIRSNNLQNSKLHDHILKAESASIDLNATKSTIHLVEELKSFEQEYKDIVNKLPSDCSSVSGPNGIYLISPSDGEPILAYCEDGWTIIQRRYDGSVDFNKNWNDYSNGFGSATSEHWIGNRNIHHLTRANCSRLQINMKDIYGKYWQANYDDFKVLDYSNGFKLIVNKYHGNASDALDYQNNMEFSTVDNDRDISNTHCASNYEGGWWFSHCQHANLNGRYNLGLTWFDSSRNEWIAISNSEMRVRKRAVC
ncbi:protein scabrous isoform X1 [Coccinella septempunctata]|uniref:protein scabrous isoform X1 n=2 Tax=Coccinella septempunctata TaxID=41139 RepID=UPI001D08A175|nr:protein scabrous isoform X1 [Coccinella septempunctata]